MASILLIPLAMLALVPSAYAYMEQAYPADLLPAPPIQADTPRTNIMEVPPSATEPSNVKRFITFTPNGPMPVLVDTSRYPAPQLLPDMRLEPQSISDASGIFGLTGAHPEYTGKNVTIAIVDTGVDFSNPDLRDSLARDESRHPVMIDADGQGIVLTNATFYATIDENNILQNTTAPVNATSTVYRTGDGVFLDMRGNGNGTIVHVYNSLFPSQGDGPVFEAVVTRDMKIGESHRDFIRSKSGMYHFGFAYTLDGASLKVVPVLVTDPNIAGHYDTITPDMSTSWKDNAKKKKYDFDFTDEKPIVLGSGNEFLIYDSDGDGRTDYTVGAVGARVLDVYGVFNDTAGMHETAMAVNGTLLPGLDRNGDFFGLMYDANGHGTSSAAAITADGIQKYKIYNTTEHTITGVAKDAKILPAKALWLGDAVYAWMWLAGFDVNQTWQFSAPRADILSNSWGISTFPNLGYAPGADLISLYASMLAVPGSFHDDYPGVVMVTGSGNSGPGYGTMGSPNAAPLVITVGATSNNAYVGYGPFQGQPRFGNTTDHNGHIVDFSSRGPGFLGDTKPDLVSIGAFAFVPTKEGFGLYGGTSLAAPLVSGAAASVIQWLRENGTEYTPFTVKNILMSSAKNLHNDPFVQGAGLLDASAAVGHFTISNTDSYQNIRELLDTSRLNHTELHLKQFEFPPARFPMASWFAGHLEAGSHRTVPFDITNGGQRFEMEITPYTMELDAVHRYNGTTKLLRDINHAEPGVYRPNYVPLYGAKQFQNMADLYGEGRDADLLVLNLHFAFDQFMNSTEVYADDMRISSLYLYDWLDRNGDTIPTSDELSLVHRGGSWGTVQEVRISNPTFEGVPLVGVYPVPTIYSYWRGDTGQNVTSMNYTLVSSYYVEKRWDAIWAPGMVTVPAGGGSVDVSLSVPPDAKVGIHQGFVRFDGGGMQANVPVSFVVKHAADAGDAVFLEGAEGGTLFGAGHVKGAFDMTNRYMAGDWRQYHFDVADGVDSATIKISWENEDTSITMFALDPAGRIIHSTAPSGALGAFWSWPSSDWLGTSAFSEGGGFYPTKSDSTSTTLYVPINATGTHTLLLHATHFAGRGLTEPLSVVARFNSLDDGPPVITLGGVRGETMHAAVSDNTLDEVYAFANATRIPWDDNTLDLSNLGPGYYIVTVTAVDGSKNYATANGEVRIRP